MVLKYNPEFAEAAGSLLTGLETAPQIPPYDISTRRAVLPAVVEQAMGMIPLDESISRQEFTVISYDRALIPVYRYWDENVPASGSALLHAHGGGFILSDVKIYDRSLRQLAKKSGVQVFSVDYRLAPESPYPTPVEDCYAALQWLYSRAAQFSIDYTRIGLMGESAGGGLVAGTVLLARDRQLTPRIAKQILIYPMLDDRNVDVIPGVEELAIWKSADNLTSWHALLGDRRGTAEVSPYGAPSRSKDLRDSPPTYMEVGELDIFQEECQRYCRQIKEAGVELEFHLHPGLPHLFDILCPNIEATNVAMESRIRTIKEI
ncbi:Alpha/Beta hydrolase protein [Aspergillus pseudocaelatus]|uniref:Alpha/Beta hydrolase protein n=1 Tax=Aspergillus pseudocaelatus TaxID=1825620 RepID=A0ABQ6WUK3_9EURO|nr:Alpha/Beta hydrolase protein [Aspergillus pseudocaelatus]